VPDYRGGASGIHGGLGLETVVVTVVDGTVEVTVPGDVAGVSVTVVAGSGPGPSGSLRTVLVPVVGLV
jgi:hypothetical protein